MVMYHAPWWLGAVFVDCYTLLTPRRWPEDVRRRTPYTTTARPLCDVWATSGAALCRVLTGIACLPPGSCFRRQLQTFSPSPVARSSPPPDPLHDYSFQNVWFYYSARPLCDEMYGFTTARAHLVMSGPPLCVSRARRALRGCSKVLQKCSPRHR